MALKGLFRVILIHPAHPIETDKAWKRILFAAFVTFFSISAIGNLSMGYEIGKTLALFSFGFTVAPIFLPGPYSPNFFSMETVESFFNSALNGYFIVKVFSLIIALASWLVIGTFWIFVVGAIGGIIIVTKSFMIKLAIERKAQSMEVPEAQALRSTHSNIGRNAFIGYSIWFCLFPNVYFYVNGIEPADWTGFLGLSVGGFISALFTSK